MKSAWKGALAALVLSSIALAQDAPAQPTANAAADIKTAPVPSDSQGGPDYVIGPEDVLHVTVWKENDLTATLPVRPDGKISLPLLDDVQASGLTPKEFAASVTEKLKKYIADPPRHRGSDSDQQQADLSARRGVVSRGHVVVANMTVLQALSSGGLSQFANTKRIYVLRTENGKQQKLPVNYRKLVKGEQIEQNYLLQPGGTIVVP
jgi:polysaccharide export outer membrane protein